MPKGKNNRKHNHRCSFIHLVVILKNREYHYLLESLVVVLFASFCFYLVEVMGLSQYSCLENLMDQGA